MRLIPEDIKIVQLITGANSTPEGWQNLLDELTRHFDLSCCNLYLLNPVSQGIQFQEWSGKRPSDIQLNDYMMNYFHTDTTHELMLTGPCGYWLTPNLRADKDVLESTDAYQKWAIPNNFIYSTTFRVTQVQQAFSTARYIYKDKETPLIEPIVLIKS